MAKKHATRTVALDQQDNERWLDVAGYEGFYQVSNHGRVKSLPRTVPMKDGRTYRVTEKILKPAWTGFYHHVVLCKSGREETVMVHLLVLAAFAGPCPEGMMCRHLDNDPQNNNLSNLCWGTAKENGEDRVANKENWAGAGRRRLRLNGKEKEICRLKAEGKTIRSIADKFGVTMPSIYRVLRMAKKDLKE